MNKNILLIIFLWSVLLSILIEKCPLFLNNTYHRVINGSGFEVGSVYVKLPLNCAVRNYNKRRNSTSVSCVIDEKIYLITVARVHKNVPLFFNDSCFRLKKEYKCSRFDIGTAYLVEGVDVVLISQDDFLIDQFIYLIEKAK